MIEKPIENSYWVVPGKPLAGEYPMIWFEQLTRFKERSPEQVRSNLAMNYERLTSNINGRTIIHGLLVAPSWAELRKCFRVNY